MTSTSIGPTFASISATTPSMASKSVTSSTRATAAPGDSDSKSRLASSLLTVPTTVWPAARASRASARPNPLLTPVMSRILLVAIEGTPECR